MVSGNAAKLNSSTSQMIAIRVGAFQMKATPSRKSFQAETRPVTVATIGAVALVVASRLPMRAWRTLAFPILLAGVVLQVLVLLTGTAVNGNQNWLKVGPITVQPSEIIKLGLVLVGALAAALQEPVEYVVEAAVELLGKKVSRDEIQCAVEKGYACLS